MGLSVLDQGPSSSASGDQKSEQLLELEALDANVMGQLAQICSEHSDGQATLRDTRAARGRSTAASAKLPSRTWMQCCRRKLLLCQTNIPIIKALNRFPFKLWTQMSSFISTRCRRTTSGDTQRCATSWAVRRPNTVTPPKLHFKIWIPSCSWKLSGYPMSIPIFKALCCSP